MIVITGASDGIGEALVRKLSNSDKVMMLARNEAKLKAIAEETGALYIVCDVRKASDVKTAFDKIEKDYGAVSVLINNAGVIVNGDLTETDDETIENVITTNTIGAIYVAKYALTSMKKAKKGLVINIVSQAGVRTKATRSIYNASKWAMTGFTKAIEEEAAEYGVRVTGLYPATVQTKLFEKAGLPINSNAMTTDDMVAAVEYVMAQPEHMYIPHLEMRPISYEGYK